MSTTDADAHKRIVNRLRRARGQLDAVTVYTASRHVINAII